MLRSTATQEELLRTTAALTCYRTTTAVARGHTILARLHQLIETSTLKARSRRTPMVVEVVDTAGITLSERSPVHPLCFNPLSSLHRILHRLHHSPSSDALYSHHASDVTPCRRHDLCLAIRHLLSNPNPCARSNPLHGSNFLALSNLIHYMDCSPPKYYSFTFL